MSLYLLICKANSKYLKNYHQNKESLYIQYCQYWDVNNLYSWIPFQKLPVNNFESIKDASEFNDDSTKDSDEQSDKDYSLEIDVHYIEKLHECHNGLPFSLAKNEKIIEKVEKLLAILHEKLNTLYTSESKIKH